ncbi:MAG: glycosyltransferase [Hydrogenothermaceae bacterium]|nr:glycosyltransferase [Hydrogenothermaceae bacterium]
MKILIYTNHLGRKVINGTAITILVRDLVEFLVSKDCDVLVVGNKDYVEEKINVNYVALKKERRINGDLAYAYRLSKIIKEFNPDIAYSFMRPMSINLGLSTLFYRNPDTLYIGSIHNANNFLSYRNNIYTPYRYFVKTILNKLSYISAPSEAILEDVKKAFFIDDKKLVFLPNFINFGRIDKLSKEEDIEDDNYILNIGRLVEQKNQEALIRIFSRLSKLYKNLKLIIVGDGNLKSYLERMVKELSLEGKIRLVGYKENPWIYFRKAKLFVLTSIFEGLPLVAIESMYFKVPIVSFDIKPMLEVTENGRCGIIVKSFDEEAMFGAIKNILDGKVDLEEIKERAYKKALNFSLENFVSKLFLLK